MGKGTFFERREMNDSRTERAKVAKENEKIGLWTV
jgi:hypothetical protein